MWKTLYRGATVAVLLYSGCVSHAAGGPCSLCLPPPHYLSNLNKHTHTYACTQNKSHPLLLYVMFAHSYHTHWSSFFFFFYLPLCFLLYICPFTLLGTLLYSKCIYLALTLWFKIVCWCWILSCPFLDLLTNCPFSVPAIQDHLCPVYSRGPIYSASCLHNNRLFNHSASTSRGWICLCSLRSRNTGVHSHCTTWTDTGSAPYHRSELPYSYKKTDIADIFKSKPFHKRQ